MSFTHQNLLVQIQQQKQKKVWNMFKVNNKNTRATSVDVELLFLLLTLNIFHLFLVFLLLTLNKQSLGAFPFRTVTL